MAATDWDDPPALLPRDLHPEEVHEYLRTGSEPSDVVDRQVYQHGSSRTALYGSMAGARGRHVSLRLDRPGRTHLACVRQATTAARVDGTCAPLALVRRRYRLDDLADCFVEGDPLIDIRHPVLLDRFAELRPGACEQLVCVRLIVGDATFL